MPKFNKPTPSKINTIWATNAVTGDVTEIDATKIQQGWIQEKPPYESENWINQQHDQYIAYINQLGIPEWDQYTEYQNGKSYVQASNNLVYKCIQTHVNKNPATAGNEAFWNVWEGNRQATTSNRGTTTYATKDETRIGTLSSKAVTPDSLGPGATNPPGTVIQYAGASTPTGYLKCNGQQVSRSQYSSLFSAIGTIYGSGDGSTTFNLPDTRGLFPRSLDDGAGRDPERQLGSYQKGSLIGAYDDNSDAASIGFAANKSSVDYGTDSVDLNDYPGRDLKYNSDSNSVSVSDGSVDGFFGVARPVNIAFQFLIKT